MFGSKYCHGDGAYLAEPSGLIYLFTKWKIGEGLQGQELPPGIKVKSLPRSQHCTVNKSDAWSRQLGARGEEPVMGRAEGVSTGKPRLRKSNSEEMVLARLQLLPCSWLNQCFSHLVPLMILESANTTALSLITLTHSPPETHWCPCHSCQCVYFGGTPRAPRTVWCTPDSQREANVLSKREGGGTETHTQDFSFQSLSSLEARYSKCADDETQNIYWECVSSRVIKINSVRKHLSG